MKCGRLSNPSRIPTSSFLPPVGRRWQSWCPMQRPSSENAYSRENRDVCKRKTLNLCNVSFQPSFAPRGQARSAPSRSRTRTAESSLPLAPHFPFIQGHHFPKQPSLSTSNSCFTERELPQKNTPPTAPYFPSTLCTSGVTPGTWLRSPATPLHVQILALGRI